MPFLCRRWAINMGQTTRGKPKLESSIDQSDHIVAERRRFVLHRSRGEIDISEAQQSRSTSFFEFSSRCPDGIGWLLGTAQGDRIADLGDVEIELD